MTEKISSDIKSGRGGKRAGAGRPKGRPNKVTAEVKELAQQYGRQAIEALAQLMVEAESEQARIAAAKELLDRGYGKSAQPLVGGGDDDPPIKMNHKIEFIGDD